MVETKITIPADVNIPKSSLLYRLPVVFLGMGLLFLIYWSMLLNDQASRAMYGYLFGFVSITSLALGSMIFVLIQHVTRAGWSVVVRRIPEAVIYVTPLLILFFIPIALYTHDIFPWTHADHVDDILAKKLSYLNEEFFLFRSFGYLVIWALMGVLFYRASKFQDATGNTDITRTMQALSAPAIVIFAITLTFASVDWIMSLEPHWYSTIFGVYYFAGCMLFGLAFTALVAMILQKANLVKDAITPHHYHDLGKLLFGFIIFWAYIGFSQFMLYWYGAIPEEVEYYSHRLHDGWGTISWSLPIIHFFVPFFALMSRALKRVKLILAINCLVVCAVHFIDLYWMIIPAYSDPAAHGGATPFKVELCDVLPIAGFFFIYIGAFLYVLSRGGVLPVGDPRLKESLAFENF